MDNKDEYAPVFPKGFSHLDQPFRDTQEKINRIDSEIEDLPPDAGPKLQFNPPGMSDGGHETRQQKADHLDKRRGEAIEDFNNRVEKEIEGADPVVATKVKDIAAYQLSDNQFNAAIKKNSQTKEAGNKAGFIAFDRIEFLQFDKAIATEPGKGNGQDSKLHYTLDEMTDSFLAKLSYPEETQFEQNAKDMTLDSRDLDFEPDKG